MLGVNCCSVVCGVPLHVCSGPNPVIGGLALCVKTDRRSSSLNFRNVSLFEPIAKSHSNPHIEVSEALIIKNSHVHSRMEKIA